MTDYNPVVDTFRSIWEALAIENGDDPDAAIEGHKRLCKQMGYEDEINSTVSPARPS